MNKTKIAIGAALAGAFVLGATVVGFSSAQQEETQSKAPKQRVSTAFSELEEGEIGKIVRAYLMENPEVIIEAVNEYQSRLQAEKEERVRQLAADNLDRLLDPKTSFVAAKNISKSKVAVIELYDYHCGYCKRAAGMVNEMAKSDVSLQVIFRELPILREESDYAAEMSLAAREQGKFQKFHMAMMKASGVLTKDRVQDLARKQGLDVEKMEQAISTGEIGFAISENHDIARQMTTDGTPTFIVASLNGAYVDVVTGFRPEELQEKIAAAKKAAK